MKHLGKRVHVLENNEGLLERDFATYAPFYRPNPALTLALTLTLLLP